MNHKIFHQPQKGEKKEDKSIMANNKIKALTFDTGGTILDLHTGLYSEFKSIGNRYGLTRDWHHVSNELRRQSLARMINRGEKEPLQ